MYLQSSKNVELSSNLLVLQFSMSYISQSYKSFVCDKIMDWQLFSKFTVRRTQDMIIDFFHVLHVKIIQKYGLRCGEPRDPCEFRKSYGLSIVKALYKFLTQATYSCGLRFVEPSVWISISISDIIKIIVNAKGENCGIVTSNCCVIEFVIFGSSIVALRFFEPSV